MTIFFTRTLREGTYGHLGLTVPKEIAQAVGVAGGDKMSMTVVDGSIVIKPQEARQCQ